MRNHYQTLKVAEDAPPEVIKAAYRALSQQHHPDSNPAEQEEEALRAMQAINAAYEALIEPEGRAAHDESLRQERSAASALVPPPKSDKGVDGGLVPAADPPIGEQRRRRRSSSSSRSRSRPGGSELANLSSEPLFRSSSRSLAKTDRSLAPLFSSSESTLVRGRHMAEEDTERGGDRQGRDGNAPRSGRGVRLVWIILVLFVLGLIMAGAVVAWRVGLVTRFKVWYLRGQQAAEGLPVGTGNDVLPMPDLVSETAYERPTQTPQGHPWPTSTGYLPGTPVLWNDGPCQITVDNTLHDSDVHAKLLAIASTEEGGGRTTVREAYIQRGTRMSFETLLPGTYELRYRALITGMIVRAATVELSQGAEVGASAPALTHGSAAGSAVMISLYKVAPGNAQRPVLNEDGF